MLSSSLSFSFVSFLFFIFFNFFRRVAEYDYVSNRADQERKKNSQYRPIIEHDGLPRLKSNEVLTDGFVRIIINH